MKQLYAGSGRLGVCSRGDIGHVQHGESCGVSGAQASLQVLRPRNVQAHAGRNGRGKWGDLGLFPPVEASRQRGSLCHICWEPLVSCRPFPQALSFGFGQLENHC